MVQIVQYFHGIGVKKWYPEKLIDGVSGLGCEELIKEVYQVRQLGASYRSHHLPTNSLTFLSTAAQTSEVQPTSCGFSASAEVLVCHSSPFAAPDIKH